MLRIITIPSLLWLCIGCSVGVGSYDLFPSNAVTQQIESTTGSSLSGDDGGELGLLLTVPFDRHEFLNSALAPGLLWMFELKNRYISDDVSLAGVTAGLSYNLPVDVNELGEGLFLMGGLSIGSHRLEIDGLPRDSAESIHASISLDYIKEYRMPFLGPFVEARYQLLEFDTPFGKLDASGFEVVIGVRINLLVFAELGTMY